MIKSAYEVGPMVGQRCRALAMAALTLWLTGAGGLMGMGTAGGVASVQAQQSGASATGAPGMSSAQASSTASPSFEPLPTAIPQDSLGRQTIGLLDLQVSGRAAGPAIPLSGDETAAAYKRYLDSFTHQIPEFFTEKVKSTSGS